MHVQNNLFSLVYMSISNFWKHEFNLLKCETLLFSKRQYLFIFKEPLLLANQTRERICRSIYCQRVLTKLDSIWTKKKKNCTICDFRYSLARIHYSSSKKKSLTAPSITVKLAENKNIFFFTVEIPEFWYWILN